MFVLQTVVLIVEMTHSIVVRCLAILLTLFSHFALAQMVTMNFKDMDIKILADTVAEVTGKTFVIDPRVKGEVTVISATPMDSKQVYEVFLSVLSVHGFSAVPSGDIIKILPDSLAKAENTPVLAEGEQRRGAQIVTQVIKVTQISAAQLIPLLRPLVPQQGHLVAYPDNNTLIISDTADNVTRLEKIIHRIDKVSEEDIEIIVLEYATAAEVTRILTTLEQKTTPPGAGNNPTLHTPGIVADERTNSILISGDKATRLRLRTIISHLDTPIKATGDTKVIYLHYARAKNLADVLKGISDNIAKQTVAGQPPPATPSPTNNSDAIKTTIQADESTNSLIITAEPNALKNLQAVISQLDVRRAQVLVEAVIAEISVDTAKKLGVQWALFSENGVSPVGISNFPNSGVGIVDVASTAYQFRNNGSATLPSEGLNGATLGLGHFGQNGFNFGVLLQALSADTNSNVLSTPSLLTLDNQEAEIHVGQNVPFVTGQYTNTGSANTSTSPFQTIQREDVGVKLKVTPQINEGNAIQLQIEQEVSSLTRSTVATADVVTNKRTIKTSVMVEDGKMVVLGGLISDDLQQVTQKVPILGDLPVLGALFRSESVQKVKRNLMIFLHPVIVRDDISSAQVSQSKYGYMRAKQLEQKASPSSLLSPKEVPVLPNLNDFLISLPETSPRKRSTKPVTP
jgi:general secretion pathway protein D